MMRWMLVIGFVLAFCAAAAPGSQEPQPEKPAAPSAGAETRPKSNPIPDGFVNLQVLPKNITKPQLIGVMKQFSITFSVRCYYCHAVSDDLTQGRFDSDEKETKVKARELLKLIYAVNASAESKDAAPAPSH